MDFHPQSAPLWKLLSSEDIVNVRTREMQNRVLVDDESLTYAVSLLS